MDTDRNTNPASDSDSDRASDSVSVHVALTDASPCPYLPGRFERDLIAASEFNPGTQPGPLYNLLLQNGFRRSGSYFFRPQCEDCDACVSIRVPVATFEVSRSQQRVMRRNADVQVRVGPPCADETRWRLFRAYQSAIHDDKLMQSEESFRAGFGASLINSIEMSYWLGERLIASGIVDVCSTGLSSVYFYYDPAESRRSLGVFSGLCEIAETASRGLLYWYLGFWVEGCAKMDYKNRFRPYELLGRDGTWRLHAGA